MNLKNYTSNVPVHQTLAIIEAYLADCGVSGIAKEYNPQKQPVALFFKIDVGGRQYCIRLPARVDQVHEALWRDYCTGVSRPRKAKDDFREQAGKTAWKIQLDWVQVQMSLVKLKQCDFREVFMAFIWDGSQTYYEFLAKSNFKALPESTGS